MPAEEFVELGLYGSSYYTDETEEEVKMLFQLLENLFKLFYTKFDSST